MAGLKETPRQKMIGMMYLVLTALLALNVQKEVLNAFVELDEGISQTTDNGVNKNQALYTQFKFASNLDPIKTEVYWKDAQDIGEICEKTSKFIDSLRSVIISETEGIPLEEADTISLSLVERLESYDESTRIMIGQKEDGTGGKAFFLRNKLLNLESRINGVMDKHGLAKVELPVDFSEREVEGDRLSWEINTFYDTPLAGTVAILSKIQNDVRNLEYASVSRLYNQIDVEDIPIDTVLAKVIPKSNYILLGEQYESDIFLGAYSTTSNPVIRIGKLNEDKTGFVDGFEELNVANGSGKLSRLADREGLFEYSGIVTIYDKKGMEKNYPFESEYLVARPSAVISPTAMNVLYKGVDNPISASVPGIPDDQISVSIDGSGSISKVSDGNYNIRLNNNAPREVNVHVSARMDNGSVKSMGTMKFRTKYLPKPFVRFQQIRDNGRIRKNELMAVDGIISSYEEDFIFQLDPPTIISFKVRVLSGLDIGQERTTTGARFSEAMRARFSNVRASDIVEIFDIKVKGKDDKVYVANSISLRIIN